jgi:protein-disulfide isomerase/uncharacterized membrane protein
MMWGMIEKKPTLRLALIPFLSAVGAGCAIYLTKHYYDLRSGTGGFNALCNINSTMSCDAAATSRFAELWAGLPLSSFVAGWFFALLMIGVMARVEDWRKEAVLAGTLMTGFASLYSIALLVVMVVVLKKLCVFCLAIDAVNFILLGLFLSLAPKGNPFTGVRLGKLQTYGWVTLGAVFVTVVILRPASENGRNAPSSAEIDYAVRQIMEHPPTEIQIPPTAAILGDPTAPITVLEFSDFQCPFCKRGAFMMHQVLSRNPGKVRVVFMPFPLDSACNSLIQRSMHPYACELARAAFCAGKQGRFQAAYEKIFEDQETLKAESAKELATTLGLDRAAYDACLNSDEAKSAVAASVEEGKKAKIASTPTFFVNGRKIEGVLPMEAWDSILAKTLNPAAK